MAAARESLPIRPPAKRNPCYCVMIYRLNSRKVFRRKRSNTYALVMCVPPCCGSEVVANTEGKGAKEDGADAVRIKVRGWRRRCEQKGGRCQYSALHCWSKLACYKSPESEQAMQCKLNALNDAVMRLSFAQPDLLVVLAALPAKLLSGSWHLWRRLHGCVARPERLTKPSYA